ncbi:ferritin-like protein [Saccharothrix sp. S26]|uniref:ferritin-like domain-containing protein n=1 Tax=Saccharothrix sp. S26 TaxID=2907215 RepID=UPI001F2240BC|nr:ferritin-like protein [Saccharothrix sp. S26]MCE7001105.1 ferritin-like protein [Saccharothrix sp. S26]
MTTMHTAVPAEYSKPKANEPIRTTDALFSHLYDAARLELSTIPLYLYAAYSIETENVSQWSAGPGAFRLIKSIVIEEMLHLSLVRNLIVAIGYGDRVEFRNKEFVPAFPSPMLHRVPELELKLAPLTTDLVRDVFMPLELPEKKDAPPESDEYQTIGQFYKAIFDGFQWLCGVGEDGRDGPDPAKEKELFRHNRLDLQYTNTYWNEGGGGAPVLVHDLTSALTAINVIVEQGEGMDPDQQEVPIDPEDPKQDLATGLFEAPHYVKFKRIADGWEPIGTVYPVPENPRVSQFPEGPVRDLGQLACASYTYVLAMLDELYNTSGRDVKPGASSRRYGLERMFVAAMQGLLFGVVKELVRTPITKGPYRGLHAAPTFEYYEFPEGESLTRHLKALCDRVLPHYPALGGDNSVLWLISEQMPDDLTH